MDPEPTLEETDQEYGISESDSSTEIDSSDDEIYIPKQAFCESWRSSRDSRNLYMAGPLGDSPSCGCQLCGFFCTMYFLTHIGPALWRMGPGEVKNQLLEFEKKPSFDCIMNLYNSSRWALYNRQGYAGLYIQSFRIEVHPYLLDLPVLEPLPEFTGSDQSFRLAKKWLETCLEEHSQLCFESQTPSPLPKRVLDLGGFPDGIRLLEDSDETAPYICLSHCWGNATFHPLRTTSENISSHGRGIPFADLPKTFREAAIVVRRLGYRYLWIDSLCIIQDDGEDWREQASMMADIYQRCLLTVAAAAAANSAQGLFIQISPEPRGTLLSALTEREDDSNVWIRQELKHEREPLGTRGWVLQERALSPRTLYFGKDELTWECLEAAACQCSRTVSISSTLKSRVHSGSEERPRSKEAIFDDWYSVVEEYSNLQLSKEEDIFPAISGISKQFRTLLGSQYIAGLWRDDILLGLRWHVDTWRRINPSQFWTKRSTKWRAPSFSWANLVLGQECSIQHMSRHAWQDNQCFKLIDAQCVPVGTDDTGQLSDAYIDLEGILVAATIIRDLVGGRRWILQGDSHNFRNHRIFPDYDWEIDGPHQIVDGDEVFCLLVSEEHMDTPRWARVWLILRETKRRQDTINDCGGATDSIPVYERVGLFTEFDESDDDDDDDIKYPCPVDLDGDKVVMRII